RARSARCRSRFIDRRRLAGWLASASPPPTDQALPARGWQLRGLGPVGLLAFALHDAIDPEPQAPALGRREVLARNAVYQQQVVVVLFLDGVGLDGERVLVLG